MAWIDDIPASSTKQISARIRGNFQYLYDALLAFPAYLKTNDKFGLRGSITDRDEGNIIRAFSFIIMDGTNPGTIKIQDHPICSYNVGGLPTVDNIGKGDSGTYYGLISNGQTLYIKRAALGIPSANIYYCPAYSVIIQESPDIYYRAVATGGTTQLVFALYGYPGVTSFDLTEVVDYGDIYALCCIITRG